MQRHPEVLSDILNAIRDYKLQDPQPERISGSSLQIIHEQLKH